MSINSGWKVSSHIDGLNNFWGLTLRQNRKLKLRTIAIYTQEDRESGHVTAADEGYMLEGDSRSGYLDG